MPKDMKGVMDEFKHKKLHSGKGGPIVKSRKQAIAIGLSEERQLKGKGKKRRGSRIANAMTGRKAK